MRHRSMLVAAVSLAIGSALSGVTVAGGFQRSAARPGGNEPSRAATTAPSPGAATSPSRRTSTKFPSVPSTSTPTVAAQAPAVEYDCSGPTAATAATTVTVEPTSIVIACADDGIGAEKLSWARWGTTAAWGSGVIWLHVCTPDCASSTTYRHYPAEITLSGVVQSPKGPVFSVMSVAYTATGPRRYPTGPLVTRFTLPYPGD